MEAGWVQIKILCEINNLSLHRETLEETRKYWTGSLNKSKIDYKLIMENEEGRFKLILYVRNIDEIKMLNFIEELEKSEEKAKEEEKKAEEERKQKELEESQKAAETVKAQMEKDTYSIAEHVSNTVKKHSTEGVAALTAIAICFLLGAILIGLDVFKNFANYSSSQKSEEIVFAVFFVIFAIASALGAIYINRKIKKEDE